MIGHLKSLIVRSDEPLIRQERFNRQFAAIAVPQLDIAVLHLIDQPTRFQIGHDLRPAIRGKYQPLIGTAMRIDRSIGLNDPRDSSIQRQHTNHRQTVPQSHLVVIGIVGRGDLHAAAAQRRVGPFVGDQWNLALDQRQAQLATISGHVAQLNEFCQMRLTPSGEGFKLSLQFSGFLS